MLFRFCLYGFLKNQRYFEPFLMLAFLDRGLSFFVIGILIGCRDLTVNILEIPSGAIADSFGRRKSMMISFVAYIVSFAILARAQSLPLIFAGMFAYGVGDTFRTGTHKAMIFEWLRLNDRTDERTQVYGYTRSYSQIGSAVSALIAAGFVIASGDYQYVFYFAIAPYVLNLINFAGYPSELDGEHQKARTVRETASRLLASLRKAVALPDMRRLVCESMGWEGFFGAIKDYLQPVLQLLAVASVMSMWSEGMGEGVGDSDAQPWLTETRTTALLIGVVFALLSLISAWASRKAHVFVERFGGEQSAAVVLWRCQLMVFAVIAIAGWFHVTVVLAIGFVVLHILKNLWRPILVSRFDAAAEAHEGATVLSIESQAQRSATMLFAPLIGLAIDRIDGPVQLWPIGIIGAGICLIMIMTDRKRSQ